MTQEKTFNIGLFNYVTSNMSLIAGAIVSFFVTLQIVFFPAAIHNYYGYFDYPVILEVMPFWVTVLYNVATVAFYTYWLSLPIIAVMTIVALKKQKIIFWLPLSYFILNVILFFFLGAQPYWDGFVI